LVMVGGPCTYIKDMKVNYTFSFLRAEDMPELHRTFLKAFEDYLFPIQLSEDQFKAKVKREGVLPSFCVAAYDGKEMVGFIMTGLGEWNGEPTAYNAGTGVVPEHRGRQLTKQLYQFMLPKLKQGGITQCLLEVIQENEPALQVYKNIGFKTTRAVDCFRSSKVNLILNAAPPEGITIAAARKPDWPAYQTFFKIKPTWQNTAVAFNQLPDHKLVLEARTSESELVGFISFIVSNGAVLQMAVHPEFRERGIGTALLREAVSIAESRALQLNNIDTRAENFIAFLNRRHFKRSLGQYEMLMPIA
jgi:ribosomal protein S18 acetylase RimI-like enzyme